jgi:hypothetical protein
MIISQKLAEMEIILQVEFYFSFKHFTVQTTD